MEAHVHVDLSSKALQKLIHAVNQIFFIISQLLYAVARVAVSNFATLLIFKIDILSFMKLCGYIFFLRPVTFSLREHSHGRILSCFGHRHYLK